MNGQLTYKLVSADKTIQAFPEWFGAKPGDTLDDSVAINRALVFGNSVSLQAGQYIIKNRLSLRDSQNIIGAGKGSTILKYDQNPNLLQWDAGNLWRKVGINEYIVGLVSDCTGVQNLKIDSSNTDPIGIRKLTNFIEKYKVMLNLNSIQISEGAVWEDVTVRKQLPIKNIKIKNVDIYRPITQCVTVFSVRGAQDINIDNLTCVARDDFGNSGGIQLSGLTGEKTNFVNSTKNVNILNSSFTGGKYPFYIAGGENVTLDNVKIVASPNSAMALNIYTSDVGDPFSVTIKNSYISFMNPSSSPASNFPQAVVNVIGRPIHSTDNLAPGDAGYSLSPGVYMTTPNTFLNIQNTTIESSVVSENGYGIPLIKDSLGLTNTVNITNSTLKGGTHAILAAHTTSNTSFGGLKLEFYGAGKTVPANCKTIFAGGESTCDLTTADITKYKVKHSNYNLKNNTFSYQSLTPIRVRDMSINLDQNIFSVAGGATAASNRGAVEILSISPYDDTPSPKINIINNFFSLVKLSSFVKTYSSIKANINIRNNSGTKVPSQMTFYDIVAPPDPSPTPTPKENDAKRKADLNSLKTSFDNYYTSKKTFFVSGSGWIAKGEKGLLNYVGTFVSATNPGNYYSSTSIIAKLKQQGFISTSTVYSDPTAGLNSYTMYTCNSGKSISLYAKLEQPTSADIATVATSCEPTIAKTAGYNYSIKIAK
jgi:hypothetical protein